MKGLLGFVAKRYIAGVEIKDAIEAARLLNRNGLSATIDNLGENVKDAPTAGEAANEYMTLLDEIKKAGVDSTVSLKLTHLGLDISEGLAEENAGAVVSRALGLGNFVRLDMESSLYTQRTIDICLRLRKRYPNVGVAIQSSLRRSASDVRLLIENSVSVRLVKGAYKEPPEIAYPDKSDVDANFSALMKELMMKGVRTAIATHDQKLIEEAKGFASANHIPKDRFEFQMLLGIRRELQKQLAKEGYKVRIYVPYGPEWLPYTLRRLRERKENIFFILKNMFD